MVGESVEKVDARCVREHTGFAVGDVAPIGHVEQLMTFIDEDVLQYEELWAAAGRPPAIFQLTHLIRELSVKIV